MASLTSSASAPQGPHRQAAAGRTWLQEMAVAPRARTGGAPRHDGRRLASAAAAAPDPVDGEPSRRQRSGNDSELNFRPGEFVDRALPQPPDVAGRADPVGERIDGAGEVLARALDLGDDLVGIPLGDPAIGRGLAAHRNRAALLSAALLVGHVTHPSLPGAWSFLACHQCPRRTTKSHLRPAGSLSRRRRFSWPSPGCCLTPLLPDEHAAAAVPRPDAGARRPQKESRPGNAYPAGATAASAPPHPRGAGL